MPTIPALPVLTYDAVSANEGPLETLAQQPTSDPNVVLWRTVLGLAV